jgi:hypothetical protein
MGPSFGIKTQRAHVSSFFAERPSLLALPAHFR